MPISVLRPVSLLAVSLLGLSLQAQAPVVTSITPVSTQVEQWGKFEIKLGVVDNWSNPYNYDEIRVSATFTGPGGQIREVEGFFMQDYELVNPQTGAINPVGNGAFKVRFSPDVPGQWRYRVRCTNVFGTGDYPELGFVATAPATTNNQGFVRSDQSNYLYFDSGTPYVPVGENIGWQSSNAYADYQKWLTKLSDQGGNYFRLWQCHWGLGLEWRNNDNGYAGLRKYKQTNAFYTDRLFDFCAERGIYVMYCLQHHGQVSTAVNPNWAESPYNSTNGGPCANTWDFFGAEAAKKHQRNKYRYCIARWGYSRNILAWELFNEVDWTDQYAQRKGQVADWHNEMAAFFKTNDPNKHLVTTSFAGDNHDANTWNLPDIDLTQTHYYSASPNLERILRGGVQQYLSDFGKPTLNGEFGLEPGGTELQTIDPNGIHLHNGMWGSLFGGAFGSAMTWWWDSYIDPRSLYHHFKALSAVAALVPLREERYSPAAATVSGAPADLSLSPGIGWAGLGDTLIRIEAGGQLIPAGASLSTFLYGSQWNTQYRRPPRFVFTMPQAGKFQVRTGDQAGQAPKIALWLDGVKVLEQAAAVNQTYSINVPAGAHSVRVDNTGTDWIKIAAYTITGVGTAADAYVLQSEDQKRLAGWVLNNRYNHDFVKNNGIPTPATGAVLELPGLVAGNYVVRYYDCLSGAPVATETAAAANGKLKLPLPPVQWDLAFTAEEQSVAVATVPRRLLPLRAWPNPAHPGETLTLEWTAESAVPLTVTLIDGLGRELGVLYETQSAPGSQQAALRLPDRLPPGLYWLTASAGAHQAAAQAIVVP